MTEYARSLAGRYPFNRDGQDVAFADFNNFYRPKTGKLWVFVEGAMSKMVQLDGDHYIFSGQLGEDTKGMYNRELLEFFLKGQGATEQLGLGLTAFKRVGGAGHWTSVSAVEWPLPIYPKSRHHHQSNCLHPANSTGPRQIRATP